MAPAAVWQRRSEALVVAVVEALLLQFPFEVQIGLGQEREATMGVAHRRDRLRPERRRRETPGALKDLGQRQHRHVAAHAVALPSDRRQLRHMGRLQGRVGVVQLQRVRPAGEIGIAPMGQDARTLIGVDPAIVLRLSGESLLAALDVEIGMRLRPRMIERGMVGHEVEHEAAAGRAPQAGCGTPPAPPSRPAPHRPHRR